MVLSVQHGEKIYPRTPDTVEAFNEHVGSPALTWSTFRHGLSKGVLTKSGNRIKIPHVRFGRRVFTSLEAIFRWSLAVAEADESECEAPAVAEVVKKPRRSSRAQVSSRAERIAAVEAELLASGF